MKAMVGTRGSDQYTSHLPYGELLLHRLVHRHDGSIGLYPEQSSNSSVKKIGSLSPKHIEKRAIRRALDWTSRGKNIPKFMFSQ